MLPQKPTVTDEVCEKTYSKQEDEKIWSRKTVTDEKIYTPQIKGERCERRRPRYELQMWKH